MAGKNIFKRCGCRDPRTGRAYSSRCPQLAKPGGGWNPHHGTWWYQAELPPDITGRRRQLKRGNFASAADARTELDHARTLLTLAGGDPDLRGQVAELLLAAVRAKAPLPDAHDIRRRIHRGVDITATPSVAEYLTEWIAYLDRTGTITGSTVRRYQSAINTHLIPHIGHLELNQLRPRHVRAMLVAIIERNEQIIATRASDDPAVRRSVAGVRPTGPASRQRVRAVLRTALNHALADELVSINAATHVKTPEDRTPPLAWTDERVAHWRATGQVPGPVMVWTADQARAFLDYAAIHAPDLYPLFHFVTYRGPRRGEAVGLKEAEVRIDNRSARISNQITLGRDGYIHKPPKSNTGNRDVFYDDETSAILTRYATTKAERKLAAGPAWPNTGLFFVRPDGHAWNPQTVSQRFKRLIIRAGLPPIRFHDLRHVAATISLQAGVGIKVTQELLGHTTSALTSDTYTTVIEELHRDAADAVARTLRRKTA